MAQILIVDDDLMFCRVLWDAVERMGHEVTTAHTLGDAIHRLSGGRFDVVFLDVHMPDGNGLNLLPTIQKAPSFPEVIIMTGAGDADGAEMAIKNGAWDYIQKPSSIHMMVLPMVQAIQYREAKKTAKPLAVLKLEGIVGNSARMRGCMDLVAQAANSEANVLIKGETGTGKEIFAWAIHNNSPRANKNFVVVDCAALADTLVESILFGYERGAFTGADKPKEGLIQQADGGTLFLDEVGELSRSVQKAFLRVLQEHRFRPVGGQKEVESDFRLVAATNRDLEKSAAAGHFRADLLFRLRGIVMELPPLRERPNDLKDLTLYHTNRLCEKYGLETKGFSAEFFEALNAHDWPGNVRELVNTLESVLAVARQAPILYSRHLPTEIRVKMARAAVASGPSEGDSQEPKPMEPEFPLLRDYRSNLEKQYLLDLMKKTEGNIPEACRISGLSRSRLYALLRNHSLLPSK